MAAEEFMNKDTDSIIVFSRVLKSSLSKRIIGKERSNIDIFLWLKLSMYAFIDLSNTSLICLVLWCAGIQRFIYVVEPPPFLYNYISTNLIVIL